MSITEQSVLTEMGRYGLTRGIEAVCDLLFKLGYIDVSRELLRRYEVETGYGDYFGEFEPDEAGEPSTSASDVPQIDGAGI